jgi:hypothetical protein
MDIKDLKQHLINLILETENESILKEMLDLLSNHENTNIVEEKNAVYLSNNPSTLNNSKVFTKEEIIARSLQSEKEYKEGNFTTLEDLMIESESW